MLSLFNKITSLSASRRRKGDPPLSRQIPYTHHYDNYTLQSKGGRLIQFIRVSGLNTATISKDDVHRFKNLRSDLFHSVLQPDINIYTHTLRRKRAVVPAQGYTAGSFSESLNRAWAVQQSCVRINEIYISVVIKPPGGVYGSLTHFLARYSFRKDKAAKAAYLKKRAQKLSAVTQVLVARLEKYGTRRLHIRPEKIRDVVYPVSEPLSFLHYLVNTNYLPLRLPRMSIAKFLAQLRPFFHRETITFRGLVQDHYGAILSVKEYSDQTSPEMLDDLMCVPHDFILTQSFACVDRADSIGMMKRQERFMLQSEDYSTSQCDEIAQAMDDVTAGRYGMGYHHCSVLVLGESEDELLEGITSVRNAMVGLSLVREDINLEPAFLAQLPGNSEFIGRREIISTTNFASFSSFHNLPQGRRDGNYWGDSVCQLQTAQGGPYYFNFHTSITSDRSADAHIIGPPPGSTTIIGQTGSGKTLLMNFLVSMAQKFAPRTIYLDKDRGVELLVRAMDGNYLIISPEGTGVNPLQLPDTPLNRSFLERWFEMLLTCHGESLTNEERTTVQHVVERVYTMLDKSCRRLRHVVPYFGVDGSGSLSARLTQWHGKGARAWLFDNEHDGIEFAEGITGFDMTHLLADDLSRGPFNLYLFHRIEQTLDGHPTIIPISEAWSHLRDSQASDSLEDYLKTIRKKNGLIIFETQEIEDAAKSGIQSTIRSQTVTNIFLPDDKADASVYSTFGLTEPEIRLVQNMDPTQHEILIKQERQSVVVRLDLSGMDEFIAVLSSSTGILKRLNKIGISSKTDNRWLPKLVEMA